VTERTEIEQDDLEYRAEFERQQFLLYDSRRLAVETHANAVIASALAISVVLVSDYAREDHPPAAWFVFGLAGVAWLFLFANVARVLSFPTPWWRGGSRWPEGRPSDVVWQTLETFRDRPELGSALREQAHEHWHARAVSAYELGDLKGKRLNLALVGFIGPTAYFLDRLLA
jgi:hypothetical protein